MTTTLLPPACRRCSGPLDTDRTRADGYCIGCGECLRRAAVHVAETDDRFSAAVLHKAVALIAAHRITRRIGAEYSAASSDGRRAYRVRAIPGTCQCRAATHDRACYHLAAALILHFAR